MNPLKRFLSRLLAWQSVAPASTEPVEELIWGPPELQQRLNRIARVGNTLPSYQEWSQKTVATSQCYQCHFFNSDPLSRRYLHCALHPLGPEQNFCPDSLPITED